MIPCFARTSTVVLVVSLAACGKGTAQEPSLGNSAPAISPTAAATVTASPTTPASSPSFVVRVGTRNVDAQTGAIVDDTNAAADGPVSPSGWSASIERADGGAGLVGRKEGTPAFQLALPSGYFDSAAALADGAGGAILYAWHANADSGVELARVAAHGEPVWNALARPLEVGHSKYNHAARVVVQDKKLVVVSEGSFGDFVELRDLATGALLARHLFEK
jgi:hypothetical protein